MSSKAVDTGLGVRSHSKPQFNLSAYVNRNYGNFIRLVERLDERRLLLYSSGILFLLFTRFTTCFFIGFLTI